MATPSKEPKALKFVLVPLLIKWLIVLLTATCRVRWHNQQVLPELDASGQRWLGAFWHNCSTFVPWAMRNKGITSMVSASRDGEYVTRLSELFGNFTIRGSTSKGSSGATRKILKLLRANKPVALTPDGPRGPKYQVQDGVLFLAAVGKAPIVPFHIEASRQWELNSWDNHIFPKPFSTIHIGFGEPIYIDRKMLDENPELAKKTVQNGMMENVLRVKTAAGTA